MDVPASSGSALGPAIASCVGSLSCLPPSASSQGVRLPPSRAFLRESSRAQHLHWTAQRNSRAPFCPCLFIPRGLFSSPLSSHSHPLRNSTPSSLASDIRPCLYCLRGTQSISVNLQSRPPLVGISHCTVTSTLTLTSELPRPNSVHTFSQPDTHNASSSLAEGIRDWPRL